MEEDEKSTEAIGHHGTFSQGQIFGLHSDKPGSPPNDLKNAHTSRPRHILHHWHGNGGGYINLQSNGMPVSTDLANRDVPVADSSFVTSVPPGFQLNRPATRTIQLLNLADNIMHADVTSAIRGGPLLDVFIRRKDRTANESFVYGEDAQAFLARARRNDIYIKNKRVEFK